MSIELKHDGPVSTVMMNRAPMNLMDIDWIHELVKTHQEADARDETRVIVTASALDGMFSNGLDPKYVLSRSEADRVPVFDAVAHMLHHLFSLKKPHICAINGPAMAGGAILAITSDFRIFDGEHGRMSFSETKVGLPIPAAIVKIIAHFCHPTHLRDIVLMGKNMDARDALGAGIADAVAEPGQLPELVGKYCERLTRLSPAVMRATKDSLRAELRQASEAFLGGHGGFNQFVGDEFLGEGLRALIEKRFPNFRN